MRRTHLFDPKLGRFLTQDSFLGQIDEPPSLHRYLYANANPLFFTDPTGHYSWNEFKSDVKWGKDFIVAFGSDLAQNAPERGVKVLKAIGTNAGNMVLETGANIHDAAVLGFEVTTGVDTGIELRSSVAQMSGEAIASGDPLAHLDVTQDVAVNTFANVVTFGIYGTAKEQYSALKDYSEGKATIEDVEDRLANAAGGAVVNAAASAAFLKATTGKAWGPDIPGLKNVPGPKAVVESVTQLPGRLRASSQRAELIASNRARSASLRSKYSHLSAAERQTLLTTKKIGNAYRRVYSEAEQFYRGRTIRVRPGQHQRTVLGQRIDARARVRFRDWARTQGLGEEQGLFINRRLYDYSGSGRYRIPDVRYEPGMKIWDGTIGRKTPLDPQILDFSRFSRGLDTEIVTP